MFSLKYFIVVKELMIESLEDHLAENYKEGETNINLSATYHSKIGPHGAKIVASTITWPI